jgi:hypothetical protein
MHIVGRPHCAAWHADLAPRYGCESLSSEPDCLGLAHDSGRDSPPRWLCGRRTARFRAGFTLYMVTIIEIYSVKPAVRQEDRENPRGDGGHN